MNYDGVVVIGTKLDTGQLEKDLKVATSELRQLEKEAEKLENKKIKFEADMTEYQQAIQEIHDSYDEYLQGAQTTEQVENVLAMEQIEIDKVNGKYTEQLEKLEEINAQIQENANAQQLVGDRVEEINVKLDQSKSLDNFKSKMDSIGNSIRKQIKQVVRWGLALLGIRTILSILSRSFNTLKEYNEELGQRMESIQLLLAVAFEPIINALVNLAERLLQIIAQIYSMLFGIDIYARANELSAKKMAKSYGGAAKSAKEMKKQLAGFDEMNVLNEPSSSSGGSGGGFNLNPPEKGEIPGWLQWIFDNADIVSGLIAGITGALIALKLGLDPLKGMGIGIALAGIVNLIIDIVDFLKDPSWEKFKSLIDDFLIDIGLIVIGIGLITNPWVALVGLIMVGVGLIIRYWDDIKEALGKLWEWLKNLFASIWEGFKTHITNIWNFVVGIFQTAHNFIKGVIAGVIASFIGLWNNLKEGAHNAWEGVKNVFSGITSFFGNIITKVISFFKSIGTKVGDAISGAFKNAINGVLGAVEKIFNSPIKSINKFLDKINTLPGVNIKHLSTFSFPRLAKGGIINQPGRGVMVGSAIAGESGREGVIPLTDSQQMQLLGEAIGKYITINANITNTMNGRVISREMKKLNNESDFAFNR